MLFLEGFVRHLISIIILCLLILVPIAAQSETQSMWAFGGVRLALNSDPDSYLGNPAFLAEVDRKPRAFVVAAGYEGSPKFWEFDEPAVSLGLSFTAGRLAFTISNTSFIEQQGVETYSGVRTNLFQFDWAIGRKTSFLGFRAQVEAAAERRDMSFRPNLIWSDYLFESNFGRYEPIDQGGLISFGVYYLLDYSWIKMAVVSTHFASSASDEALNISFDSLLNSLGWGLSVETPTYTERNELRLVKARFGLDFANLGSTTEREFRFGASVTLQLLPTYDISLIVGYREAKNDATDWLGFDVEAGYQTQALALKFNTLKIVIGYGFPTAYYTKGVTSLKAKTLIGLRLFL